MWLWKRWTQLESSQVESDPAVLRLEDIIEQSLDNRASRGRAEAVLNFVRR